MLRRRPNSLTPLETRTPSFFHIMFNLARGLKWKKSNCNQYTLRYNVYFHIRSLINPLTPLVSAHSSTATDLSWDRLQFELQFGLFVFILLDKDLKLEGRYLWVLFHTYLALATHSIATSEVPDTTLVFWGAMTMMGAIGSAGPPTSVET